MSEEKQLALFSETEYDERAPNGYPVSCPTLDLSATWDSTGRNLFIYRPPRQAVSKIHQVGAPGQKAPEAQAVTWKPDGEFHPTSPVRSRVRHLSRCLSSRPVPCCGMERWIRAADGPGE